MRNHKPNPERVRNIYKRYLSKNSNSDIWARELINGLFEIDDYGTPLLVQHDTFLEKYRLFEEINNGLD